MSKIVEFFGADCSKDASFGELMISQICPFTGAICTKMRKSDPKIKIGTCVVKYQEDDVIICPKRLLAHNQIFIDCLHLLTMHEPGNELYLVPEVSIPGGNVDYFLVSVKQREIMDFVGIELQTMDTTGSVWPERQAFLYSKGLLKKITASDVGDGRGLKTYGMNWKMTLKTILIQMHHKSQTFENLNKHFVLIIQNPLLKHMLNDFDFSAVHEKARLGDPVHIHSYALTRERSLTLETRLSTNTDGIAKCLGLKADANLGLEDIFEKLRPKLTDSNRLKISF